ncbi:twin-arginine translocase subunit TatC [Salsipaludibacter albus]|uniref:twin-arginine translocase subunit TatC n=1 Tax=Salsipaludibacter albus TaxID=2849650 RepID=UPI0030843439|nr:twin-arginine translocase subunit TatC [Salsipaludibacter albus]
MTTSDVEQPLVEHLTEFRDRLLKSLAALVAGAIVGYVAFDFLLGAALAPVCATDALVRLGNDPESCSLIALTPLEPLTVRIKTAIVVGLFIGGPVIFYQLWRFITPGLTDTEKKLTLPFVLLSQLMFAAGIVFAWFIIPQGLRILLGLGGDQIVATLSASEYLNFFLRTSIAFGLVFEIPLVLIFLSLVGVVSSTGLRKFRPYSVVVNVALAAIITPTTDALTLFAMAGPMIVFYEVSIWVAWLIERRRRRQQTA